MKPGFWGVPAENYNALYNQACEARAHKYRLETARCVVDCKPVPKPSFDVNKKRQQMKEDRYNAIEVENRLLLEKMSKILREPAAVPFAVSRGSAFKDATATNPGIRLGPRTLNRPARKKELERINLENQRILKRIQTGKGCYDKEIWKKERDTQEKFLALHKKRKLGRIKLPEYKKFKLPKSPTLFEEKEEKEEEETVELNESNLGSLQSSKSAPALSSNQNIFEHDNRKFSTMAVKNEPIEQMKKHKPLPVISPVASKKTKETVVEGSTDYLLHESISIDGMHVIIQVYAKGKFLMFKAYDPETSCTFDAQLGVSDVKMLLSDRLDLFQADMRKELCKTLTGYLHFITMNGIKVLSFGKTTSASKVPMKPVEEKKRLNTTESIKEYSDDAEEFDKEDDGKEKEEKIAKIQKEKEEEIERKEKQKQKEEEERHIEADRKKREDERIEKEENERREEEERERVEKEAKTKREEEEKIAREEKERKKEEEAAVLLEEKRMEELKAEQELIEEKKKEEESKEEIFVTEEKNEEAGEEAKQDVKSEIEKLDDVVKEEEKKEDEPITTLPENIELGSKNSKQNAGGLRGEKEEEKKDEEEKEEERKEEENKEINNNNNENSTNNKDPVEASAVEVKGFSLQDCKIVFVLGGPGSGKGTQCERIVKEFGYTHLSTGDLLRAEVKKESEVGKQVQAIMASGGLAPMEVVLGLVRAAMESSNNNKFLIDGYPRELAQAFAFEKLVAPCSFVLYFEAADQVLISRCIARGISSGRSDDNEASIVNRVSVYHSQSKPAIDFFTKLAKVRKINATETADEVYKNVRKCFIPEIIFVPENNDKNDQTSKRLANEYHYTYVNATELMKDKATEEGYSLIKNTVTASSSSKFIICGFPSNNADAVRFEEEVAPCKFVLSLSSSSSSSDIKNMVESFATLKLHRSINDDLSDEEAFVAASIFFSPAVVFVLGGPGSGKGTQCERIRDEYKYTHLSAGDLLRAELDRKGPNAEMIAGYQRDGKLVPLEVTLDLLKRTMRESGSNKFLIDGFPRAVDQAELFESSVAKCSRVLFFDVDDDILVQRLIKRGLTSGRADDNEEAIKKRLVVFHEQSRPAIDYYEPRGIVNTIKGVVDGVVKGPEEIFSEVKNIFEKKVVFVLGGPGAGKGTICERVIEKYGYTHLSTGDLLRAEVKRKSKIGSFCSGLMEEGKIVPLDIMISLVLNAMKNSGGNKFLLDGFPRSVEQAVEYEKSLGKPTGILYLELSEEVMVERLLSRGLTSGRSDDNAETIKKRLESFRAISFPVLDYYKDSNLIFTLSAVPPAKEVFENSAHFFECLGNNKPFNSPPVTTTTDSLTTTTSVEEEAVSEGRG